MGISYAEISIRNLFQRRRMPIKVLVDSGSVFLTVPDHIALQLGFDTSEVGQRESVLAEGSRKAVPMIGPLRIYFADRTCDLSALVLGDEPLIGAVPMEMRDLVLHPATQTLSVNPASPFVPVALAQ
jgi:clan AA aspartic protease